MTSAYILIAAMLLLGGLIAVLGDRLGSKIGKARLRLFNLRPRQTAQLVTILTGTLISASTFGILFALSESLRQGVFELDTILKELRQVKAELSQVKKERNQVEKELAVAQTQQTTVQERLQEINQNFKQAQTQLKTVSNQAKSLRSDIKTLLSEREQLVRQKNDLSQQIARFREQLRVKDRELSEQDRKIAEQDRTLSQRQARLQELEKRQSLLQGQIDKQDRIIGQLDNAISEKDRNLQERETQLKELESQQTYLKREVEVLEQYYQTYQELREKRIAIVRGQVLAFAAVRIVDPDAVVGAVDRLLRQANRTAIVATDPGNEEAKERVVKITKSQVEQLVGQIKDGQDYVVRILSAGNYVQGEKEVRVFADVALNQQVFKANEVIATISIDAEELTEQDIQKRIDILLAASQFRARRAGILGDIQVEDGSIKTLLAFIEQLNLSTEIPDEIRAIASEQAYTVGPLKLRLVAIKEGKILFGT
jgi:uncharacterized protein (DUF3084 family)